ncbi:endoribonuclease Dicer [Galendromus occidentalis]|uniref:Endoribonuclease Dicer n=1 Tax=Galendromus occidentalis TaxID=34638 RepID=A0AAJ7WJZ5_9ACAR|nr:endoribonuclease Dicer [Galendromus occidentalis]
MSSSRRTSRKVMDVEKNSEALLAEQARSYQIELFEFAKKHNTIVCLGTGTGKTFISVLLVKHFEHEVAGPWIEGSYGEPIGKRTVFLAPSVPLVEQQSAVLAQHMTVKVASYVGSMDTDRWSSENWNREFNENGVLVMTPEVCRIAIDHGFLPMENINLLVLDECHRATGDDPYVKIMENYANLGDKSRRPRILGLTASVVNAKVQGFEVQKKIRDLEACLDSVAKTSSLSAQNFGTKPTEIIVTHHPHDAEKQLPIDAAKMALLEDCADYTEFRRNMKALASTYHTCGPYCAKVLVEFRERELQKALQLPDCAQGFKDHAHIKFEIFKELYEFLGDCPSLHDVPPRMTRLLEVIRRFEKTNLSAVVFVKERLVAYVLYNWMRQLSVEDSSFAFIRCSFIVGQAQINYAREIDPESLKMNSKAQNKVMKNFRNGEYNLMFATSVIEEGMDVPACNLIIRFDPPMDVRSYTQSKGRARAKPSLYVVLSSESDRLMTEALLDSYQETEQLVMKCCGTERIAPTAFETAEKFVDDPDLPPYVYGRARITAKSAISIIYGYCQRFMRLKYPNLFPFFDMEETPDGFVCTLSMPIVCPVKEKISNRARPFPSKDKAKSYVALEMCKRLHQCGELADNLLPRRMYTNLYKLHTRPEDVNPKEDLKKEMLVTRCKAGEKKRYVLPRKRASILELKEEGVDCDPLDTYHLYVIRTEVVSWTAKEQNWRGDPVFDPVKYPTWLAIVLRSKSNEMQSVPKFPIFTRSGEECVSFEYAGAQIFDDELKSLCARFNRYVFSIVLDVKDNLLNPVAGFNTPCLVPVDEINGSGRYSINMDVLWNIGRLQPPNFDNFEFRDEDYDDAVVELLYHINENQKELSREVHSRTPQDVYSRFYVTKTRAVGEDGQPLTPNSTGYYQFDESLSFAEYGFRRTRRTGPEGLLEAFQPVLEVEHAHKRLRMLKPRSSDQQEKKQKYLKDVVMKYVLPQFVAVHKIKASLWRKLTSIPTIVHRLNRLLLAEDVRRDIALACRLKPASPSGQKWPYMEFVSPTKAKLKEMNLREFDALVWSADRSFDESKLRFRDMAQPDLENCLGPSPCDLMKALTTRGCEEIFDLERLELLGDSFLQIVSTFAVMDWYPDKSISELNVLRQYEVNNSHLLYRAHEKGLTQVLEAQPFRASYNFLPFGHRTAPFEQKLLQREFLCCLVKHWGFEAVSSVPRLKDLRFCKNIQEALNHFAESGEEKFSMQVDEKIYDSEDLPKRHEIPVRSFHDFKAKIGGDVVEAMAGVYLEKCGPVGALRFFKWIGKDFGDTETNNFLDAFKLDFSAAQKVPPEQMRQYSHLIDKVERQVGYKFKSRGLALQAITHHSCREHLLTDDMDKLAFVGEAVIDYLLTLYIYGLSTSLNPGQLTDLRSALINKQVTAYAVVRAELHTVLLHTSNKLFSAIKKYLSNFEDIGLRLNTVIDDSETDDSGEAEIPSPIARILLSILGAVFIDSGKSLETVWSRLVRIMGYEILLFTNNVPISPIKEVCQKFPGTFFSKANPVIGGEDDGRIEVSMAVVKKNGELEWFTCIADNKKIAKVALAKKFLRGLETKTKLAELQERKEAHETDESVSTLSDDLLDSEVQRSKFYRSKR